MNNRPYKFLQENVKGDTLDEALSIEQIIKSGSSIFGYTLSDETRSGGWNVDQGIDMYNWFNWISPNHCTINSSALVDYFHEKDIRDARDAKAIREERYEKIKDRVLLGIWIMTLGFISILMAIGIHGVIKETSVSVRKHYIEADELEKQKTLYYTNENRRR